jgi:glycosyltransferase involved in cell wall biosynthesis
MQISKKPLVSVLMTSYNRQQYIAEAIECVLESTFSDFELIIVDDKSLDNTYEIIKSYASQDKRIRVYQNEKNLGQFANRNKIAELAKGEYLMFADSDDKLYADGIERCMSAMHSHPEAGFAIFSISSSTNLFLLNPAEAIRKHFFENPFLTHGPGATIIKRSVFQKIGGFPLKYSIAGDMYYNLNAASHVNVLLLPFRFVNYRIHEGQELNNRFDYLWANYNYLRDAVKELPFHFTEKENVWLINKNRRRFLLNIISYFFQTLDLLGLLKLINKSGYRIYDLFKAIFHKNL